MPLGCGRFCWPMMTDKGSKGAVHGERWGHERGKGMMRVTRPLCWTLLRENNMENTALISALEMPRASRMWTSNPPRIWVFDPDSCY